MQYWFFYLIACLYIFIYVFLNYILFDPIIEYDYVYIILVTINKQHPSTFPSVSALYNPASIFSTWITVIFMAFTCGTLSSNIYFPPLELRMIAPPPCTLYITVELNGDWTLKKSIKLVVHDKVTF